MDYEKTGHYVPLEERERISDHELKMQVERMTLESDGEYVSCEICNGTGEVTTMESVYSNEPHQAPIGIEKCICQLPDEDDYQEEDR